ncbi:hypothetical protein TrRE_jg12557 [Triparma retinervis]|uniref:Uncharacterized protein n=1 Tax=Triparma retinervis TaxID=2557542 RepID=A0A9W7DQ54_9STRA|nr:hypothetical protein TrRE_jg12557 [Triparma retinervis]
MSLSELDPTTISTTPLPANVLATFVGTVVSTNLIATKALAPTRQKAAPRQAGRPAGLHDLSLKCLTLGFLVPWICRVPIFDHPLQSYLALSLFFSPLLTSPPPQAEGSSPADLETLYASKLAALLFGCLILPLDHGMQEQRFPAVFILAIWAADAFDLVHKTLFLGGCGQG